MVLQGKQGARVPKLIAGDIGGVAKLKLTATGDTLSAKDRPLRLGWIEVPSRPWPSPSSPSPRATRRRSARPSPGSWTKT